MVETRVCNKEGHNGLDPPTLVELGEDWQRVRSVKVGTHGVFIYPGAR